MEIDHSQAEEMELAAQENRQPLCVTCCHPLDKVVEEQHEDIVWKWKDGKYVKMEDGYSDGAKHVCKQCPDGCGVEDDFVGYTLIDY